MYISSLNPYGRLGGREGETMPSLRVWKLGHGGVQHVLHGHQLVHSRASSRAQAVWIQFVHCNPLKESLQKASVRHELGNVLPQTLHLDALGCVGFSQSQGQWPPPL